MLTNDTTAPRSRRQISIDRALAKAHEQARAGNLPTLLRSQHTADGGWRQVWAVGSRTTAGSVYTIDLSHDQDGIATLCDCAAAEAERVCWHRAAARLAHLGELAWHDPITGRTIPALTADAATATLAHFTAPDPAEPADWTTVALAAG